MDPEPGIVCPLQVEYTQSGQVFFTVGDALHCEPASRLLQLERAAGTYLPGLGPSLPGRLKAGRQVEPTGSGRASGPVAPRALVCIDAASGERYRAIPIEGTVESLHCAGHFLVAALSQLRGEGTAGALVVLDFSGEGFDPGETRQRPRPAAAAAGRPRTSGRGSRGRGKGRGAGAGKRV